MEVQRLPKYDPGSRHLLTVVDALTKYAWVLPLKKETGTESVKAFEKVLKNGGDVGQRGRGVDPFVRRTIEPLLMEKETQYENGLRKHHRPFKKGYLPGRTEEVFVVCRVQQGPVPSYKVEKMDGTPLEGPFHEQDRQKGTVDDDSLFRVENYLSEVKNSCFCHGKVGLANTTIGSINETWRHERFYVTLPSSAEGGEFSNNNPNHFKVRLPYPLHFQEVDGKWD